MRKSVRYIIGCLLGMILVLGMCGEVMAAGNVTYSGDAGRFIFSPGSDYSPTDLFEGLKNVMPGDCVKQQVVIKNSSRSPRKIKIYMRAAGAKKESELLLSQMRLKVEKEGGGDVLFDASADETGGLTQWTLLGTVYPGGNIPLNLLLEVPVTLGNEFQDSVGYLDWQFRVEELPIENKDPRGPKTGDVIPLAGSVIIMMTSLIFMGSVFTYTEKRAKKRCSK